MKSPARKSVRRSRPRAPQPTRSVWAEKRQSPIHGSGMIASRLIPAETQIIEYVGEKVTKTEADRRDAARVARRASGDDGCVYLFELNARYDLDGEVLWNTARYINHSCDPNCEPRIVRGRIWIVALRDIQPGEELTYDYGFDFDNWRDHPCRCGTNACVGYIVKKSQRWRVRRILTEQRARRNETRRA